MLPDMFSLVDPVFGVLGCLMVHAVAMPAESFRSTTSDLRLPTSELLVERARARLQADSHRLRNVSCDYHRGALRLRGEVPTYYLKQLAQSLLLSMSGGHRVRNELIVPLE